MIYIENVKLHMPGPNFNVRSRALLLLLVYSSGWESYSVTQAAFELPAALLLQPAKCSELQV